MPQNKPSGTTIERALELQALVARLFNCADNGGSVTLAQADAKAIIESLARAGLARRKPGPDASGNAKPGRVRVAKHRALKALAAKAERGEGKS